MKRNLILLTLGLTALTVFARTQSAAADQNNDPKNDQKKFTAKEKLASVESLIGDWDCKHTVGDFSGTYKTSYSRTMGDAWLRQTYKFPATQENATPGTAEALMTYSPSNQAWLRFFGNSEGQHFSIRMADTPTGWAWTYVSFFKWRDAEKPDAIFTRKSDTEYTIDGPSYERDGVMVTEHHTCHKQ